MRILHCADLHLDSRMTTVLPAEKARERRQEILQTFRRMISFAEECRAEAVIIAGDLFDRKTSSMAAGKTCISLIQDHPDIQFFYVQGNHDTGQVFAGQEDQLPNLHQFSPDRWTTFAMKDERVKITGIELTKENQSWIYGELNLEKNDYNIVILHGQTEDSIVRKTRAGKGNAGVIPLRTLAGKQIDYLALGHIHKKSAGRLDGRGIWCYPGCMEGRGFDECGEHGCVLVDINPDTHETSLAFYPLASRTFHDLQVDISTCRDDQEILRFIRQELEESGCSSRDLVRIRLAGETRLAAEISTEVLAGRLSHLFYYLKIENRAELLVDDSLYEADPSMKGEFVRLVRRDQTLTEEQKSEIIRRGIRLLTGAEEYEDS